MIDTNATNSELKYDGPAEKLNACAQMRNLSVKSKLVILYALIAIHLLLYYGNVLLYTVVVIAHLGVILPLLKWWKKHSENCALDAVIRSFGLGYVVMVWIVGLVGTFLVSFIGILSVISLIGFEELLKVLIARKMKKDMNIERETAANQLIYTAVSIGYAISNIVHIVICAGIVQGYLFSYSMEWKYLALQAAFLLAVLLFTVPIHVLSGYLIGLNTTRQLPFWTVGLESFLLRTLFTLAIILEIVFLPLPWNFCAWIGSSLVTISIFVLRIKNVEKQLPIDYLHRVGYLQAFGYGVLPDRNVNEVEVPPHSRT